MEEHGLYHWEKPVEFAEGFKWSKEVTFTVDSYMDWVYESLPVVKEMSVGWENRVELGKYSFYLRSLPMWHMISEYFFTSPRLQRSYLSIYRGETSGNCRFDGEALIPILATTSNKEPWMSLTPNEILTLRGSVRRSKGRVGIAGLGMGWVARKVLERSKVSHLTVVERDEDVLSYFGPLLQKDFGDRIELVHGDAYEHDWSGYDVSLWDIWKSYGCAAWDRRYQEIRDKLRRMGNVCVGWGEGVTV